MHKTSRIMLVYSINNKHKHFYKWQKCSNLSHILMLHYSKTKMNQDEFTIIEKQLQNRKYLSVYIHRHLQNSRLCLDLIGQKIMNVISYKIKVLLMWWKKTTNMDIYGSSDFSESLLSSTGQTSLTLWSLFRSCGHNH